MLWCAWCKMTESQITLSWKRPVRIIRYNSEVKGRYGDWTPMLVLLAPCSSLDDDDPCHYESNLKHILWISLSICSLYLSVSVLQQKSCWNAKSFNIYSRCLKVPDTVCVISLWGLWRAQAGTGCWSAFVC